MNQPTWKAVTILAGLMLVAVSGVAGAQSAPPSHRTLPYFATSGAVSNDRATEHRAYETIVDAGDAAWVRLVFAHAELAPGSRIEIVSQYDGARQTHTRETLARWGLSSAYFNGARLRVTLISAPGAHKDSFAITELLVDDPEDAVRSQCGPTDERVPSAEPARARLLNIGCTAQIYDENSCFITAGHCLSSSGLVNVVQFNVPPSLPNGALQHPGPEDQYTVNSDRQFIDGGVGNDWGLFKTNDNTETGLTPFEAQGTLMILASSIPPDSELIRIVGYGVDSGSANQTQQESTGPLVSSPGNTLNYQTDTEGGNSGSAVTWPATGEVIGIHTHGGCNISGSGANSGTAITHPNLQLALADFCTAPTGGIVCGDVNLMRARCNTSSNIQVLIRMSDTSHLGENVTVTIDGSPQPVGLDFGGGRIGFWQGPGASGVHTVSLSDPAGCEVPDVIVNCPE